ncbi:MAG: DUF6318 family protein [Actinomycetota bacterium]|nr:DUF6318 family protein [Actinomycetota bacterium]
MQIRILCVLCAAVVGLSGCSGASAGAGGGTPPRTPSVARVSAASPSPTRTGPLTTGPGVRPGESPPVEPVSAAQHTVHGAELSVTYYFEALDWSIATLDPYLLHGLSSPSCGVCTSRIVTITAFASTGIRVIGGRSRVPVVELESQSFRIKADEVFRVVATQDAYEIVDRFGHVTSSVPAQTSSHAVFVSWVEGRWLVAEIGAA